MGQTNGLSDALSLPAVLAALEIEAIDPNERPELTRRLFRVHTRVSEIHATRQRLR